MRDRGKTREQLIAQLSALRGAGGWAEFHVGDPGSDADMPRQGATDGSRPGSQDGAHELLHSAADGVVIVDGDGRIALVNDGSERLFGYRKQEMLGQPVEMLLPDRLRRAHVDHRVGYFAAPRVRTMGPGVDLVARRKDGSEFPVEISLSFARTDEGRFGIAFVTDATNRRQAESHLEHEHRFVSAVLETAAMLVVVLDRDGRIVRFNRACEETTGYTLDDVRGQHVWDVLLAPEEVETVKTVFRAIQSGTFPSHHENSWVRRDGERRQIAWSNTALLGPEDAVQYVIATGLDITERKRAEDEVRRQREALYVSEKLAAVGRLVTGIVHEVNNPLGIISSRIELMLMELEEQNAPASLVEDLRVLHRNSQRVVRIANSLRSFARQAPTERGPIDLNASVVEETLLLVQTSMVKAGINIILSLDRGLPLILGDASALQQVLLNLLTNAREAMPEGGEIRIETARAGRPGWVRLVVADAGPGIAPEHLPRIFEPFYTTKARGTGLGLSVSYGIIQAHEGSVDIQSQPGKGASVTITFPTLERQNG